VTCEEPETESKEPSTADAVPPPDLQTLWNSNCGLLPKVVKVSTGRRRAWGTRFRDNPDLTYWEAVIQRLAKSDFCNGARGWVADVDFLLRPDTHLKTIEGKYDNRTVYVAPTLVERPAQVLNFD
jgi:hypothetical protein